MVFSYESALCIRWPKYWSFSLSPSNEFSGLTSFRIDWFDLFAVQETLKSLLQHQDLKASILLHPAFFMVQLSHPYMPTGKTIALTIQTFVGKVMYLFFNMLYRFVIPFLPNSKGRGFTNSWGKNNSQRQGRKREMYSYLATNIKLFPYFNHAASPCNLWMQLALGLVLDMIH